jgi:hypothetical protein
MRMLLFKSGETRRRARRRRRTRWGRRRTMRRRKKLRCRLESTGKRGMKETWRKRRKRRGVARHSTFLHTSVSPGTQTILQCLRALYLLHPVRAPDGCD